MKKAGKILAVISLVFVFTISPLSFSDILSWPQAIASEEITGYQEWDQSRDVYGHVYIRPGATLVIKNGVTVNFRNRYSRMYVYGSLDVQGSVSEPVVFASSNKNGQTYSIEAQNGSNVKMRNARVINGGTSLAYAQSPVNRALAAGYSYRGAIQVFGGNIDVQYVFFENNYDAMVIDRFANASVKVNHSAFIDNGYDVEDQKGGSDFQYNWWGSPQGPKQNCYTYSNGQTKCYYEKIYGNLNFSNWLSEIPQMKDEGCQENCFSNVMFLPGIKASKLYKDGALGTEDQLWPPNYFGNDVEELFLDENGKSINDVYTDEPLKELPNGNIYKTFINEMEELEDAGTINNFQSFAYDWRQSVEDVAKNGTPYEDNLTKNAVVDLRALAESSKSKKVTLVAHSNGGLLAKAMMMELERSGMAELVDKIIFVGSPQMGTPLATLSLLYGYDEAILGGTLISREEARTLAENMPGAYGLLPSEKYFERTENPFVTFSSQNTRYKDFFSAYGGSIDSYQEFKKFLLGTDDGRSEPDNDEVETENVLNAGILEKADEMHTRLDAWVPPAGVEVIQIAGWGLDTVSGVNYAEKEKTKCTVMAGKIPVCINMGEYEPIYDPKFTLDGDKVVATPSALMFPEGEYMKRYWVNLDEYNETVIKSRGHKDLLEVDSVLKFIFDKIKNVESASLPQYIQTSRPSDYANAKPRLRMSLYSPLDIHLYDEAGNHTGPKTVEIEGQEKIVFEENIPNSYYYQMGERKYVGFPADEKIRIEMEGYALGTYTLKLEEVKEVADGENVVSSATFSDLPTTEKTIVKFNFEGNGLEGMSKIEADVDGDEEIDYVVEKNMNGAVELPLNATMISQKVDLYAQSDFMDEKTREFLQVKLKELIGVEEMIVKMDGRENENPKNNQIKLLNKKIDDLVSFVGGKLQDAILSPAREALIKNLESIKM